MVLLTVVSSGCCFKKSGSLASSPAVSSSSLPTRSSSSSSSLSENSTICVSPSLALGRGLVLVVGVVVKAEEPEGVSDFTVLDLRNRLHKSI